MRKVRGAFLLLTVGIATLPAGCVAREASEILGGPVTSGASAVPEPRPVATMSDLMARIIYPASDAVFYIATRTPTSDSEWAELELRTIWLAEAANLLMMPERSPDRDLWLRDADLLLDAATRAVVAARARDVPALEALNDPLYEACVTCHQHYRPGYGRR